jgi:hypothetical protein
MVKFSVIDIGKEMGSKRIDDFSKVRNNFLETLNDEEYILFLDSDEEAPKLLLELCKRVVYTGIPYFRVRRVNLHDWKWYAGGNPDYNDRLVSNKVRFHGKVHESVRPRRPFGVIDTPIIHNHLGPKRFTSPPYYFHGIRLDIVPFAFRCYVAFNYALAMITGGF